MGVFLIAKRMNDHGTNIPIHVINALAKSVLPDILKFYESKEGQEYFKKWKAEKQKDKST